VLWPFLGLMPPAMRGTPKAATSPPVRTKEERAADARAKIEERNRQRSEQERKKAAYQAWLAQHEDDDANDGDAATRDGMKVTDEGVFRESMYVRNLAEDGPDAPDGRDSMVNHWFTDKMSPDYATFAARQSVRQQVENGVLVKQIGFDKHGTFHPVRHFHSGSAYERYRRGMPPGYMGYIPHDAVPVTGGKVGVIEKKHPVLYSTVRPATGFTLTDILDDKFDSGSSGVGEFEVEFRTHANNDKDGDGVADGALFTRSGA